ncbi:polysaccharide pyruvyl transferase family protein [Aequorivita sp. 609]|uniref:polysaccharide pyruvyl transferase family protein n=1 Tax=Aequorivita TaxID=153265 RepID=UPI00160D4EF5|nr:MULTISPECIES: polysaccharide pyruvyl transferase family protein [Aequorivita]MBB6681129.1 polysaccharide pyruvyl transferase family protein [Aequorivita sp. 609]
MKKLRYYLDQLIAEIRYLPKNIGYLFTKKRKAVYIGCTGHSNLGDEGVFIAIQGLLKEKIYLYPISYVKPSSGKYLRSWLFKAPDLIILGGGTIIKKSKKESYLKLLTEYHFKFPNAELVVFGSGVADPELAHQIGFPSDAQDWKVVLDKCLFIGVRGELSKIILRDSWAVKPEISIIHDPAIYFKRHNLKLKDKQKKIAVNFCNIIGRIYGLNQKHLESFAVELVSSLLSEGWKVFLYPTAKSDIPYMKNFLGSEIVSQVRIYENYKNLEQSLSFMESIDVFVGQRLHSIIFAAITYTPFYAIEYESKTTDFLMSLGVEGVSKRTDQLEVDKVLKSINILYSSLEAKQSELFQLVGNAYTQQNSIAREFLKQF